MLGNALELDKLRKNSQLKRSREEKDKIHQSAAGRALGEFQGLGEFLVRRQSEHRRCKLKTLTGAFRPYGEGSEIMLQKFLTIF
jgi:hypothetical protein